MTYLQCRLLPMVLSLRVHGGPNTPPLPPPSSPFSCEQTLPSNPLPPCFTPFPLPLTHIRLFFLSGLPTAEKPAAKKYFLSSHNPENIPTTFTPSSLIPENDTWHNYRSYLSRTSIVIPFPPALYKPLPEVVKGTVFLDFPMYRFDEEKDGRKAIEEANKQEREVVRAAWAV